LFCQKGDNVQGDPRAFLKLIEKQQMMEIWKTKAKKQAQWINRYPTQILNQSKRVWKWAIEEGKGSAWIYYIFAICQWLPNNHRVHYSESVSSDLQKCKLCLMNVVEDTNHIFSCPALLSEQMNLHAQMEAKLKSWKVLLAEKQIESLEHRTCRIWFKTASTALITSGDDTKHQEALSSEGLWSLIRQYWTHNMLSGQKRLMVNLRAALKKSSSCPTLKCQMTCSVTIHKGLLEVLAQRLHLQVEGITKALHRSSLFSEWCSSDPADITFGARGSLEKQDLAGHNTFIFLHSMESKAREKIVDLIREWISSKKPTRVIIIAQRSDVEPWFRPNDRKFLELAKSDCDFPLIHLTATISGRAPLCSAKPMSIVLALNKESMLFDPIDWPALKSDLIEWAAKQCPGLVVSTATDKLFRERVIPGHRARVRYQEIPKPMGVYSPFSPHSSKGLELKHLVQIGVPVDLAKLINRTNLHEKGLTMLGILPRQFKNNFACFNRQSQES